MRSPRWSSPRPHGQAAPDNATALRPKRTRPLLPRWLIAARREIPPGRYFDCPRKRRSELFAALPGAAFDAELVPLRVGEHGPPGAVRLPVIGDEGRA
jgi:hypothetical protein